MKFIKHTKRNSSSLSAVVLSLLAALSVHAADPRTNSWFTANAGKYARIYTSDANMAAGNSVTTWNNGAQNQSAPAYAGVQAVYSSADWVYIRSSGLASHVMGPWYLNSAHNMAFPNYPVNEKVLYRFPRNPAAAATKTLTGLGAIGYFVDGVAMFDSRDGYVWNGSTETGNGTGYWNRDAYVNENVTFDPGYAHQEQTGTHHYHADPIALRYQLGDHVDFNPATKTYSESTNAVAKHSPILGWVRDGYPIYGPYGYSNPTNPASGVRRMISGYVLRNGQDGTQNLTTAGRNTIPAWASRLYNVSTNQTGPSVSSSYPLGRYMEDNDYLGDLGYVQGVDFDLDEYNGRYCITPEFPNGTYAYFVSVSSNGAPIFPYDIGRAFYGNPTGSSVSSITENVTTNFLGETNHTPMLNALSANGGIVTLTWNALEGGTYMVQSTTNLVDWATNSTSVAAQSNTANYTNNATGNAQYYRVARTALATFDSVGLGGQSGAGGTTTVAPGGSAARGTSVTVTITLPSTPPWPPANALISSVTLAGSIAGTGISDSTQGQVVATFAIPANAATGAQSIVVVFNSGPTYTVNSLNITN